MKASAHDKIICGIIFSVFFGLSAYAATKDAGWSCLGFWVLPFGYILMSIWTSDKVSFLIKGMLSHALRLGRIRYGERALACRFAYRFFRASHYLVGFRGDLIRIP